VKETVSVAQATRDEAVLPERVQEALGQLVGAAKEGLLALSVGVGLGVLSEMLEEEVDEVVGPKGKWNQDRTAVRYLPRESEWVFTTIRGTHYTPSARTFHWNRVRCAVGLGNQSLYICTRHHFGWLAMNVLGLEPHLIALQLGHTDGGQLVRELYGHPDAAIARDRVRKAFRHIAPVRTLVAA
jgi:hypothetical protein